MCGGLLDWIWNHLLSTDCRPLIHSHHTQPHIHRLALRDFCCSTPSLPASHLPCMFTHCAHSLTVKGPLCCGLQSDCRTIPTTSLPSEAWKTPQGGVCNQLRLSGAWSKLTSWYAGTNSFWLNRSAGGADKRDNAASSPRSGLFCYVRPTYCKQWSVPLAGLSTTKPSHEGREFTVATCKGFDTRFLLLLPALHLRTALVHGTVLFAATVCWDSLENVFLRRDWSQPFYSDVLGFVITFLQVLVPSLLLLSTLMFYFPLDDWNCKGPN